MSVNYKVDGVEISAVRDRAMFNTFAGNEDYIIAGIGNELNISYDSQSFNVELGTGEAVIRGGSMLALETTSLQLGVNESGSLVIEIDLSQTGTNICQFKAVASPITSSDINDGDWVYDFELATYSTNDYGVIVFNDLRKIKSSAVGVQTINNQSPLGSNFEIVGGNGVDVQSSQGQIELSANSMELLWTNSSPTATFVNQTITLNYTKYSHLLIVYRIKTSSSEYFSQTIDTSIAGNFTALVQDWSSDALKLLERNSITNASKNSIAFSSAYVLTATTNSTTDNTVLVPYKIYGIS